MCFLFTVLYPNNIFLKVCFFFKRLFLFLLCLFGLIFSLDLETAKKEYNKTILIDNQLTFESIPNTGNPLPIVLDTYFYYRIPFFKKEKGPFLSTSKIEIGLRNIFRQESDTLGLSIRFQPILIFQLNTDAFIQFNYPTLGYGYFALRDNPQISSISTTGISEQRNADDNDTAFGTRFSIEPEIKLDYSYPIYLYYSLRYTYLYFVYTDQGNLERFYDFNTLAINTNINGYVIRNTFRIAYSYFRRKSLFKNIKIGFDYLNTIIPVVLLENSLQNYHRLSFFLTLNFLSEKSRGLPHDLMEHSFALYVGNFLNHAVIKTRDLFFSLVYKISFGFYGR